MVSYNVNNVTILVVCKFILSLALCVISMDLIVTIPAYQNQILIRISSRSYAFELARYCDVVPVRHDSYRLTNLIMCLFAGFGVFILASPGILFAFTKPAVSACIKVGILQG